MRIKHLFILYGSDKGGCTLKQANSSNASLLPMHSPSSLRDAQGFLGLTNAEPNYLVHIPTIEKLEEIATDVSRLRTLNIATDSKGEVTK
jgi:hypothetical protein